MAKRAFDNAGATPDIIWHLALYRAEDVVLVRTGDGALFDSGHTAGNLGDQFGVGCLTQGWATVWRPVRILREDLVERWKPMGLPYLA